MVKAVGFYWDNDVDKLRANPPVWRDYLPQVDGLNCTNIVMMSAEPVPDGRLLLETANAVYEASQRGQKIVLDLAWHRLVNDPDRRRRMIEALRRLLETDAVRAGLYSLSSDEPDPAGAGQFRDFTKSLKETFPSVRTQVVYSVPNVKAMTDDMNDYVDDIGFDWYFWSPNADQFGALYDRLEKIARRDQRLWIYPETFVFQAQLARAAELKEHIASILPFYHRWAVEHPRVHGVFYFIWNAPAAGEIGLGLQQFMDRESPHFHQGICDQVTAFGQEVLATAGSDD
jgi:hypothetical protein